MTQKKNLGINAILNVIKSGLSVLFPLITYPYALRVLGAEGIGKVSYSTSIISYFSLLAMLGVSTYGVREGAKIKHEPLKFSNFVNEIFTINMISTTVAYLALAITLSFVTKLKPYAPLIALQSVSIIFTTLGVDWINTVYEDFLLITVRSILMHIISLIMLFLFVKTSNDYYTYALLTIVGNIIVCVSNWFYIRRYARVRITLHPRISKHIKPLLIMFSNAIATSVYVNFDTTMLGWMQGDVVVGQYSVAVKVYGIIKGILAAIYAVAVPRLASYLGQGDASRYKKLYTDLWKYLTILLIPSGVGLGCLSREIMQFMGGAEYLSATLSLQILSLALVFAIYGGLTTAVLNITIGKEKDNLIATVLSAVINCLLNLIFIPLFSLHGAAVTTCISEAFVLVFCLVRNRNINQYLDIKALRIDFLDSIVGSFLIIGVAIGIKEWIGSWILRIVLIIITSIIVYGIYMVIRRNQSCLFLLNMAKKKVVNRRA